MRDTRTLVSLEDARIVGRATAEVLPHQQIEVPVSGLSGLTAPGGKCDHGVYIPAPYLHTDRAPYCSLCRPYEIIVKEHGTFKA